MTIAQDRRFNRRLGKRLALLRKKARQSQDVAGHVLGVTGSCMSRYEGGMPLTPPQVQRLAAHYGTTIAELFNGLSFR